VFGTSIREEHNEVPSNLRFEVRLRAEKKTARFEAAV